jgi:hypothetical protein
MNTSNAINFISANLTLLSVNFTRLFTFLCHSSTGPVVADGFGLGYIIKDEGMQICCTSFRWIFCCLFLELRLKRLCFFQTADSALRLDAALCVRRAQARH